jgi:DNA-binding transcriptional LysR family regulator
VTQSAVSQQIRALEERYGKRLLERTRGSVQLTPAGEIFYEASKEIVQRHQEMEARLHALAGVVGGTVRVATVHSIGLYELSSPMKRYLKAYPQVNLHLEYSRSNRIYEDALKGNVDLGIVAYPARRPQITVIPFREDRLVLVCPPGHQLAKHKQLSIRKLAGQPLVGFERDIPTRRETDRMLRRYGIEVRYVMELDNIETIKRVVEIGSGVAILPEPAVRPEVKGRTLAAVQFSDETFLRPLGIIHRQGKHFSPAAAKFIELLRAE